MHNIFILYLGTTQELNGKAGSSSVQVTIAEIGVSFLHWEQPVL